MQVKVTCTLNLTDETADVNQLEEQVFKLGLKLMAELMRKALAALEEQAEKSCSSCRSRDLVADGTVPRCREAVRAERLEASQACKLMGELGRLLRRGRVDEALGLVRSELKSQAGMELAGYRGVSGPGLWMPKSSKLRVRLCAAERSRRRLILW